MKSFGTASVLLQLARDIADLEAKLPKQPRDKQYYAEPRFQGGLLGAPINVLRRLATTYEEQMAWWTANIDETLKDLLNTHTAAAKIYNSQEYCGLVNSLAWHAKRNKGLISDQRAKIWLLSSTIQGLGHLALLREQKIKLNPPEKDDWKNAILAARTLKSLEAQGVVLDQAISDSRFSGLPYDWLTRIERALVAAARDAKKPHVDKNAREREAIRTFARWNYMYFGEVPPSIVTKFGDLVGYAPATLATVHLPDWLRQFRTHSIY